MTPHPLDIIIRKRDGHELTTAELQHFVRTVVLLGERQIAAQRNESVPLHAAVDTITEAQTAAFLMAVFERGMTVRETADLTQAMRFSGEVFDNSALRTLRPTFTVDKHSTGGVGDKTSLLIAPILAAAGLDAVAHSRPSVAVPMISGRSLGHTGGTLDKLETIPGFSTQLAMPRINEVLRESCAVLVGQTPQLVPADRTLYALRDHTGTVESRFLITASIMSKKLAEDINGLVLDVKTGSGAFMPTYDSAKQLAELMVATGEAAGTRTIALLTRMEEPLGRYSGNWLEVLECVQLMQHTPLTTEQMRIGADLLELSLILSGWMLHIAGLAESAQSGRDLAAQILTSGAAYDAWLKLVAAHGGNISIFSNPAAFHRPAASCVFTASRDGYLVAMDCKQVGWAVQRLGAGRANPGDPVSAHAGIEHHAKLGDKVHTGQPIFTLYAEDRSLLDEPLAMLRETVVIGDTPPTIPPLVREIVQQ